MKYLCFLLLSTSVFAQNDIPTVVKDYYEIYKPLSTVNTSPAGTPCGTANFKDRTQTLEMLNYFRKLAGVAPVVTDPKYDVLCDELVVVLSTNNFLNHTLPTTLKCYTDTANRTASSSSISRNFYGPASLLDFIKEGSGWANREVGHRRWLLLPELAVVGISSTVIKGVTSAAIYVKGPKGNCPVPVMWPPAGACPVDFYPYRWSYCEKGMNFPSTTVVKVNGKKLTSGITRFNTTEPDAGISFIVGTNVAGWPYGPEDHFVVEITGGTKDGLPKDIKYECIRIFTNYFL